VAAMVAFLASPAGAYVSGATLHVNGGMYMSWKRFFPLAETRGRVVAQHGRRGRLS